MTNIVQLNIESEIADILNRAFPQDEDFRMEMAYILTRLELTNHQIQLLDTTLEDQDYNMTLEDLLPLITPEVVTQYYNEVDKLAFMCDITGLRVDDNLLYKFEKVLDKEIGYVD